MATEIKWATKFGQVSLASANNAIARWMRGSTSPLDQKGSTGWLAELYGGVQTGDDWARLNIPVNEMPINHFKTANWSWYQTNAEVYGVNLVIWLHDPTDFDKRCEVTQSPSGRTLEKGAGWNAHELDTTVTQFFYYGENTTGSGLTAGTQYTWAQFQADTIFSHWTVYRLTLDWGWYSTGTFESAYVADVRFNNETIQIAPTGGTHKKTVVATKLMTAAAQGAGDVVSESSSAGTDWDFDFGGTGYITKAIVTHDAAITPRFSLLLFTTPPTGVLNDNVTNTSPVTADVPFYIGRIDYPAMSYDGTGDASTIATPSTAGNLPLAFDSNNLYGILVTKDIVTLVAEALTIQLTADMED